MRQQPDRSRMRGRLPDKQSGLRRVTVMESAMVVGGKAVTGEKRLTRHSNQKQGEDIDRIPEYMGKNK